MDVWRRRRRRHRPHSGDGYASTLQGKQGDTGDRGSRVAAGRGVDNRVAAAMLGVGVALDDECESDVERALWLDDA